VDEDLTDLCLRVRGLCTEAEAARAWPSIIRALERQRGRVQRLRPNWRRSPILDDACDRAWRAVHDAPVAEELREPALAIVAELKRLVGPDVLAWRLAPAPRRRWMRSGP
jgi:hypothetical protein